MNKKSLLILEILLGLSALIVLIAAPFTIASPFALIGVISLLYVVLAFIVMILLVIVTVTKKEDPDRGVDRGFADVIKNLQFVGRSKKFAPLTKYLVDYTSEIEKKATQIKMNSRQNDIKSQNESLSLKLLSYYYNDYYNRINELIDNIECKDVSGIEKALINFASETASIEKLEDKIVFYLEKNVELGKTTVKELDHILDIQHYNKQLRSKGQTKRLEKYTNTFIIQINDIENRVLQIKEMLYDNFGEDRNCDEVDVILDKYKSVFYSNLNKVLKRIDIIDTTNVNNNLSVDEALKKEAVEVYNSHVGFIEEKANMNEKITIELEKLATELSRINDSTGDNNLEPLQDYIQALKNLNDNTTDDELTQMMSKY